MDLIIDIEAWMVAKSKSSENSFGLTKQTLSDDQKQLVELFQTGAFIDDIRANRAGDPATEPLLRILHLIDSSCDMPGFMVYRGLMLEENLRTGDIFAETSISSWTVFPSIAMRIALGYGHGMVTILRYRLLPEDPSFYVDDWEYEVRRGPYVHRMGAIVVGSVNYMNRIIEIRVVDLVQETSDE
jgi:hypothetical protein